MTNPEQANSRPHFSASGGSSRSSSSQSLGAIESSLRLHEQHQNSAQPSPIRCFLNALSRKKPLDCRTDTSLNRCLSLLDLTSLGVGSTLGLGLYVLAGQVASNRAGPAVILSFAMAAVASAFSALCYAEFAGRVPRAGSAYAYSYICVGEFVAFVIGWNMILEYVIGASSVARGFSGYLGYVARKITSSISSSDYTDPSEPITTLTNNLTLIHQNTTKILTQEPLDEPTFLLAVYAYLVKYFDWLSIVIMIVVTLFILIGAKESTNITLGFTVVNLLVVITVVVSSLKHLDLHNWNLTKDEVPTGFGEGGFLPYGWAGVLSGSATCFFAFIGFDTIASSAEESKNPKRNVPFSIMLSLFISFLTYMAMATVQTLLWPYYDQNKITILPFIFNKLDMPLTYWTVLLGAIAGLASSLLGGLYPLPRILYSMANDKLIYHFLGHVNRRLKLPVRAVIIGSIFVGILSCLLDIEDLADMVSIGTLAAYSLVSLSVLILRYEDRSDSVDDSTILRNNLSVTNILETSLSPPTQTINSSSDPSKKKPQEFELQTQDGAKEVVANKPELIRQPSIPIREKGSKAVVAQLSVGFHSWFKSDDQGDQECNHETTTTGQLNQSRCSKSSRSSWLDLLIGWRVDEQNRDRQPDQESSRQSKILIGFSVVLAILLDLVALWLSEAALYTVRVALGCTGCIVLVVLAALMLMLSRLPTSRRTNRANNMFQVPLVPLVPMLSLIVNTFLMLNLNYLTWVRFTVWMAIGLFIYFTYGIWKSKGYLLDLDR